MKHKLINSFSVANIHKCNRLTRTGSHHKNSVSTISNRGDNLSSAILTTQDYPFVSRLNVKKPKRYLESFDRYKERVRDTLAQYRGINDSKIIGQKAIPLNNSQCENLITAEDKAIIKKIQFKNKKINSLSKGRDGNSSIRIRFPEKIIFDNPYESLRAVRQNHKIYNDINKTYFIRQQIRMDESIESMQEEINQFRVKMPIVKVSPLISNNNFESSSTNQENNYYLFDKLHSSTELKLFAYFKYPNKNFPEGREQFALVLHHNKVLLVGGLSVIINNDCVWSLDLESLEWSRINSNNSPPPCRFGHSASCFINEIFLYGGRVKKVDTTELVDYCNFNLDTKSWSVVKYQSNSNHPLRRNHISEIVGHHLIVHGGQGKEEQILNDTIVYAFSLLKWFSPDLRHEYCSPSLYGHTSCFVVPYEFKNNSRFNMYKYPDTFQKIRMKEMGIYIFGGVSKDKRFTNDTYVLLIGKPVLEWKKIETNGKKPMPRSFHSMNFYEKGNFIIIHGGRNDNISSSFALDDTFLLDLTNFDWMEIKLYSNNPQFQIISRCGHSGVIYCK